MNFAPEDLTLTEKTYLDGYEDGSKTLLFDTNDIQDKLLSKSKLQEAFLFIELFQVSKFCFSL